MPPRDPPLRLPLRCWTVLETSLALFWLFLAITASSQPSADMGAVLFLLFAAFPLAASALLRSLASLWLMREDGLRGARRTLALCSVTPAAIALANACEHTDADFHLRFRLCRDSLTTYAQRVAASDVHDRRAERAGLFWSRRTETIGSAVLLVTTHPTFAFDESGLVYAPKGLPEELRAQPYRTAPLSGDWHTFYFAE